MKRFYCSVCQKMKRVQNWPISIEFDRFDIPNEPQDRVGECNYHQNPSLLLRQSSQAIQFAKSESKKSTPQNYTRPERRKRA